MKKVLIILCVVIALPFCITNVIKSQEGEIMRTLVIKWQRLVDKKGQTCERCGLTEKELQKAFQSLKKSLAPLGIKVTLEKKALDPSTCAKDVSQSNRIWIGGRTLEEWLGAKVGKSPCGFCYAELGDDVECRTVSINGKLYEAIPTELIIKSGLLAAAQLLDVTSSKVSSQKPSPSKVKPSACCPKPVKYRKTCK